MKKNLIHLILILGLCLITDVQAVPNFTFIQISDTHAPMEQSAQTIRLIKNFNRLDLQPYGIKSYSPSFIIATGDLTEYGEEGWQDYLDFWKEISIPRFDALGNHDNTWASLRDRLRALYGSPFYSFDTYGCHFIVLESATPQEPLPSFGYEQILWLKEDLKNIKPETPIFLSLHHPLDSPEFISDYEKHRILDLFENYNLVCILVGHGHSARYHNFDGYDGVQGGSSFGGNAGFNLITVSNNTLYVCYYTSKDSTAGKGLLEKPILRPIDRPTILISNPVESKSVKEKDFELRSIVYKFPGTVTNAEYRIDGGDRQTLANAGSYYGTRISTDDLTNGLHLVEVLFTNSQTTVSQTQKFIVEKPTGATAVWRYELRGSSKASPCIDRGVAYAGANDGRLYAIDTSSGKARWTFTTDGEILTQPVVVTGIIYFGSGDGNLYAMLPDGKPKWRFKADSPIYSSPVAAGGVVYFGSKKGTLYALRADDGVMKWKYNPGPTSYCIESAPMVENDAVYYTSWDSYVYAIDTSSGELKWRSRAAGSTVRSGAKKYYSAADSSPLKTQSNIWTYVSDRDWYLSAMELETGVLSWYTSNCLAISGSESGDALYMRTLKGDRQLQKWALDGKLIWASPVQLNDMETRVIRFPVPAIEKKGKVYTVSCWGTLYCLDGKTGSILWQYQVTPRLAVISSPAVDDNGIVYVSAMDGTVSAIQPPK